MSFKTILRVSGAISVVLLLTPLAHCQPAQVSGRYECAHIKLSGKILPCTAPPLTLKNNGQFELRGWEGDYLVSGQWVELTDSLVKARAKIEPGHKIVLKYRGKHGLVEMIYVRRVADLGKTHLG
jgi:hypothetical protein